MELEAEKKGDCLRSRLFSLEEACGRIDETMNAKQNPRTVERWSFRLTPYSSAIWVLLPT